MTKEEFESLYINDYDPKYDKSIYHNDKTDNSECRLKWKKSLIIKRACFRHFGLYFIEHRPGYRKNWGVFNSILFRDFKYTIRKNKRVRLESSLTLEEKTYLNIKNDYKILESWYHKTLCRKIKNICGSLLVDNSFLSKFIDLNNEKIKNYNQKYKNIKLINLNDKSMLFLDRRQKCINYLMKRDDILPCIKAKFLSQS